MAEEWFDVVDDHDSVVGRETRPEVHRRGLRHRAVHVFVIDRMSRVFLQKRSMAKDSWPGAWDSSASGHVDSGESYDACALRELREELGWLPEIPPSRILRVGACDATGQEFTWVYSCRGEGPFALNPDEIEGGRWFDPGEVDRAIEEEPTSYASSFRHIWSRLRAETEWPPV